MSENRKKERTDPRCQRDYWDALSDQYASSIRISTDDFHYGPQIPGEKQLRLLPQFAPGATALEIGCGGAQNSIYLSRRGLKCTALDISARQLRHAKRLATGNGVEIEFLQASLEDFDIKLEKGILFDFVHSSHALEFTDDPAPVVRAMARRTRPGGTVMVSTVHPLFNGEWIDGVWEDENGETGGETVPGVFLTNYFDPPDDIRQDAFGHAVSRAWPVSLLFDCFTGAGLRVTALAEPKATPDAPYTGDDWAAHGGQLDAIPSTLILVGTKQ